MGDGGTTRTTPNDAQNEDFSISYASGGENSSNSNEEYDFDHILAERQSGDVAMYLVKWTNYPLSNCTWELAENFQSQHLVAWEAFKEKTGRRTLPGFKVANWKQAIRDDTKAQHARHERRMRRRIAQGQPTTEFAGNWWETYLELTESTLEDFEEPEGPEEEGLFVSQEPGFPVDRQEADSPGSNRKSMPPVDGEISEPPGDHQQSKSPGNPAATSPGQESYKGSPSVCTTTASPEEAREAELDNEDGNYLANLKIRQVDIDKDERSREIMHEPSPEPSADHSSNTINRDTEQPSTKKSRSTSGVYEHKAGVLLTDSTTSVLTASLQQRSSISARPSKADRPRQSISTSTLSKSTDCVNVFIGGKVRQPGRTIEDAAKDATKAPHLLKLRHQRILQKRQRDSEGTRAPAHPSPSLRVLSTGLPAAFRSNSTSMPTQDDETIENVPMTDAASICDTYGNASHPDRRANQPDDSSNTRLVKRKRSVHWDENISYREAPASHQGCDEISSPETAQAAADMDITGPQSVNTGPQSVDLLCYFGKDETQPMSLTFSGLPEDRGRPWLQHLKSQGQMVFTHCYSIQDLQSRNDLREEEISQGFVMNALNQPKLDEIALRLREDGRGLFCHNGDYCVLMTPVPQGQENSTVPSHLFDFFVFKPTSFLDQSMLLPLEYSDGDNTQASGSSKLVVPVFDAIFGLDFEEVLALSSRKDEDHNFFLAFPSYARQEAYLVAQWLRLNEKQCQVRTSLCAGQWAEFLTLDHGILIMHEDTIGSLRLFPKLNRLLSGPTDSWDFFVYRNALDSFMDSESESNKALTKCTRGLRRVLCPGNAFLLTPSFLVSYPQQAYLFVKWFWQNYSKHSPVYRPGRLVVWYDIEDWALKVSLHKSDSLKNPNLSAAERKLTGLNQAGVHACFKTWSLLRNLIAESSDAVIANVDFAPEHIDGNDEQSLVNWFGWYAVANMDYCRKFLVIGTGDQLPARSTCLVDIPVFVKQASSPSGEAVPGISSGGSALQLVPSDDGGSLQGVLGRFELESRKETFRPLVLFKFPISYWNANMPFHFGDYASVFSSFQAFFKFSIEFIQSHTYSYVNSCAGFFYTIEGDWDRAQYPKGVKFARRPWLAIFRIANPHIKPWKRTELFIWDSVTWAKGRRHSSTYEGNLIPAQRELIKMAADESQSVLRSPLDKVWLGGCLTDHGGERFSDPLDITLNWFANLAPNVRELLPAPQSKLEERNWKPVIPGAPPPGAKPAQTGQVRDVVDNDGPAVESEQAIRHVFPPPGREGVPRRSIRNKFYDWAEALRKRGKHGQAEFVFEPTLKWYKEQVENGQALNHIDVTNWRNVFARHRIPDPKSVTEQAGEPFDARDPEE